MKEEDLAVLNGKIDAISIVFTQLIATTVTPLQAAEMALGVKIERETVRDAADYATPETEIAVTERLLDAYVEMLSAAASRA